VDGLQLLSVDPRDVMRSHETDPEAAGVPMGGEGGHARKVYMEKAQRVPLPALVRITSCARSLTSSALLCLPIHLLCSSIHLLFSSVQQMSSSIHLLCCLSIHLLCSSFLLL
jgi:hypothetical protein